MDRKPGEIVELSNGRKAELVEFWNSPWCEFLLGGVEPSYARQALGVPTLERRA